MQTRPAGDPELVRAIGLGSAVLFVAGSVIGSGIFLTTGMMAAHLPSASLLLSAWALGGLLTIAGGLTFAEMGAMFPRSGGVYAFLREAFGPLVGFLYGWAALTVIVSGGIAGVAVGFADYLSYFAPSLSPARLLWSWPTPFGAWSVSAAQVVAAISILALGAINYVGVRSGNLANVVLTIAKIVGLAALPVMAIAAARVEPSFLPIAPAGFDRPLASFGIAMIAVLWTYEAWYFVTYAAGEIKDPHRNVPRALTGGIVLVTVIYLAVNLAYLYALTIAEMQGVSRVAERAAAALVGPTGATLVAATVIISTLGCNAAGILGGSRLLYAMAADRVFFTSASRVHPRYRTPHVAVVAMSLWSAVLALSGTYEQLFTYVMFASILFSVATGLALFRLRQTMPDRARPYRTLGYPWVPAVFVLGSLAFVVNTLLERPTESIAGLAIVAAGVPAYWYYSR